MNNAYFVDVIACVAPENNPSKAKRVHRSEIERWEEIVIRQTIIFFCFNPPSSSKVSPNNSTTLISFPYCLVV